MKELRKRTLRRILVALAAALAALLARPAVVKATLVKQILIETQWPLSESDVSNSMGPVRASLVEINTDELLRRVRLNPWVETAWLKKEFPSRLRVIVKTKSPAAILVQDGTPFLVDSVGNRLAKAKSELLSHVDLYTLSFSESAYAKDWNLGSTIKKLNQFTPQLDPTLKISQVVLDRYPYARLYLSGLRVECALSFETWDEQTKRLLALLKNPPADFSEPHRIELTYPKKAVVRSLLSN